MQSKTRGHFEQDANSIANALESAISSLNLNSFEIKRAGLAIQRSSVVAWDKNKLCAVSPCISWMDTRESHFVSSIEQHSEEIQSISGLVLSPHYSASKLRHLIRLQTRNVVVTPLASFLISALLGESTLLCDESIAARTQLYDINKRSWSKKLLNFFQLQNLKLPKVLPTSASYGFLKSYGQIELVVVCGDQSAAYHALSIRGENQALLNLGTGGFLLKEIGGSPLASRSFLNTIISSSEDNVTYALEGTINGVGAALGTKALQEKGRIPKKEIFVNTVGGLGSPFWSSSISSHFEDLNFRQIKLGHIKSVHESIAFLVHFNIAHMMTYLPFNDLIISGGVASNKDLLTRIYFDGTLSTSDMSEATLLGLAISAGFCEAKSSLLPLKQRNKASDTYRRKRNQLYFRLLDLSGTSQVSKSNEQTPTKTPLVHLVAHRGDCRVIENTLASLILAINSGAKCLEFDLQITKDKELVLFHDRTLRKLMNESGSISDYLLSELKEFKFLNNLAQSITTFAEVKSHVNSANINNTLTLFVELKRSSIQHFGLEQAVEIFADGLIGLETNYYATSFSLEALKLLKQRYKLKTALVLENLDVDELSKQDQLQSEVLAIDAECLVPELGSLPELNTQWMVYDALKPMDFDRFVRMGATYIETKQFSSLKVLLDKRGINELL